MSEDNTTVLAQVYVQLEHTHVPITLKLCTCRACYTNQPVTVNKRMSVRVPAPNGTRNNATHV